MVKSILLKHSGNQNLYCSIPCRSPPPPRGNISSSPPSVRAFCTLAQRTFTSLYEPSGTASLAWLVLRAYPTYIPATPHSLPRPHSPQIPSSEIQHHFYFLQRAFFRFLKKPISSLSRVLTSCLTPRLTEELI